MRRSFPPLLLFLFVCQLLGAQQTTPTASGALVSASDADRARVFITDSQSWEYVSNSGGSSGAFASHGAGGARPQTAEIVKTFGERCPQVITNNKMEKADYVVVLDHEGGKGLLRHKNKVAVFNRISGDSIVSKSTLSLGGSVQDACEAIEHDWTVHSKEIRGAEAAAVVASQPKIVPAAPAIQDAGLKTSVSKLTIASNPSGADIEIDGNFVGNTPSEIEVGAGEHTVVLSKKGYSAWQKKLKASGGSVNLSADLDPAK
jgi:hypothetical protein